MSALAYEIKMSWFTPVEFIVERHFGCQMIDITRAEAGGATSAIGPVKLVRKSSDRTISFLWLVHQQASNIREPDISTPGPATCPHVDE